MDCMIPSFICAPSRQRHYPAAAPGAARSCSVPAAQRPRGTSAKMHPANPLAAAILRRVAELLLA